MFSLCSVMAWELQITITYTGYPTRKPDLASLLHKNCLSVRVCWPVTKGLAKSFAKLFELCRIFKYIAEMWMPKWGLGNCRAWKNEIIYNPAFVQEACYRNVSSTFPIREIPLLDPLETIVTQFPEQEFDPETRNLIHLPEMVFEILFTYSQFGNIYKIHRTFNEINNNNIQLISKCIILLTL